MRWRAKVVVKKRGGKGNGIYEKAKPNMYEFNTIKARK